MTDLYIDESRHLCWNGYSILSMTSQTATTNIRMPVTVHDKSNQLDSLSPHEHIKLRDGDPDSESAETSSASAATAKISASVTLTRLY